MYDEFKEEIKKLAQSFKNNKYKLVKVVSHNDCDGICAAAILAESFRKDEIHFSISIVKRVSLNLLKEIERENWELLIFSDLGSSYLKEIKEIFKERDVMVFDHHLFEDSVDGLNFINPHGFGIKEYNEISGAGIVYLFSKFLNEKNKDLSYLALIGAIGDVQGDRDFVGLNKEILNDAVSLNLIEIKKGLRIFGSQTRPLHKMLEYSTDTYIPGVTGNEAEAIRFLEEIGIKYKNGNNWLRLADLNKEDLRKLVTGIILRRLGSEEKPEDVFGNIYLLKEEAEGSLTKDLKEFSTLLNACGRMGKPSLGVSACLNKNKSKALGLLKEYKSELINSLNWFNENKTSSINGDNFCIINAKDNIKENLIGVLTSMVAKSNLYSEGTILVFMAYTLDGYIKFSGRIVGKKDINLKELFSGAKNIGAEIGGHKSAAGGTIERGKEKELLEFLKSLNRKIY